VIEAHSGKLGVLGHGFTYGGHPMGCAVGVKALEIYQRRNIVKHVQDISPIFKDHMERLAEHPLVGEQRSLGLMGALEMVPNTSTKAFATPGKMGAKLAAELLSRGVIVRAVVDSIVMCPPMVITIDEINEMFAPMEAALDATAVWAKAEGLTN